MPTKCAIIFCGNYHSQQSELHFFTFPKNKNIRKQWIQSCHRDSKFNGNNARICSKHFVEADYENWLEYKTIKTKLRLKNDAVPTKYLKPEQNSDESRIELRSDERSERYDIDLPNQNEPEIILIETEVLLDEDDIQTETDLKNENIVLRNREADLKNENEILRNREANLKNENEILRSRAADLKIENEALINRIIYLESKNKSLTERNELLERRNSHIIQESSVQKNTQKYLCYGKHQDLVNVEIKNEPQE